MYYISDNRSDLQAYNNLVKVGERYDNTTTTDWANVVEHKDGGLFAILKHENYHSPLQLVSNLTGWFDDNIL